MKVPRIRGVIRRRILVNFRVDPAVMQRQLPEPFRPKLHGGFAIAGICLIRLERIRPRFVPSALGLKSENAAHRIAVEWGTGEEGVFIPRRDSDSRLNHLVGGRLFPGEHHEACFEVVDSPRHLLVKMTSKDRSAALEVAADSAAEMPPDSIFKTLEEASVFFERGSLGYSVTREPSRYDGLVLETENWKVSPLSVRSSYFEDETAFPAGSVTFDHALVMRDIDHQWVPAPDLYGSAVSAGTAS